MRAAWLSTILGVAGCAGDPVEGVSPGSTGGNVDGGAENSEGSTGTPVGDDSGPIPSDDSTSSSESTAVVPPGCGDGRVEGDEVCDDGNEDDTDACTHLCTPPACDDGIRSGDESDVDCGGECSRCGIGSACDEHGDCDDVSVCAQQCRLPRSCEELLEAHPDSADGDYTIELEDDRGDPFEVRCDMAGGGWTRVSFEDFEDDVDEAWSSTETDACDGWGSEYLGRFAQSDGVQRSFDLLDIPHDELKVRLVFIALDSWDDEEVRVRLDDDQIWAERCISFEAGTCGQSTDHCANPEWNDGTLPVDATGAHTDEDATVRIEATLDTGIGDESWGIDDVAVFVR